MPKLKRENQIGESGRGTRSEVYRQEYSSLGCQGVQFRFSDIFFSFLLSFRPTFVKSVQNKNRVA